jgi:hypothetical protein
MIAKLQATIDEVVANQAIAVERAQRAEAQLASRDAKMESWVHWSRRMHELAGCEPGIALDTKIVTLTACRAQLASRDLELKTCREALEMLHRWCTEDQLDLSRGGITRTTVLEKVTAALSATEGRG